VVEEISTALYFYGTSSPSTAKYQPDLQITLTTRVSLARASFAITTILSIHSAFRCIDDNIQCLVAHARGLRGQCILQKRRCLLGIFVFEVEKLIDHQLIGFGPSPDIITDR
jgi:hypothetical protein